MMPLETLRAILDTIPHPLVYVDNDHIIRYYNRAADQRYHVERKLPNILGKSVFDFHKPESNDKLRAIYQRLLAGEDEIYITTTKSGERATAIAVRTPDRTLLGYYERFEKPAAGLPTPPATQTY